LDDPFLSTWMGKEEKKSKVNICLAKMARVLSTGVKGELGSFK